ncbi:hypothetical protein BDQ17DRAFT_1217247, partial [Cyathus striatus]
DQNMSHLSYIHKLPNEILSDIFSYAFDGVVDVLEDNEWPHLIPIGSIWDLQLVCMRWRNIVQGSPLLW